VRRYPTDEMSQTVPPCAAPRVIALTTRRNGSCLGPW